MEEQNKRQRETLIAFDSKMYEETGKLAWFSKGMIIFMAFATMVVPFQDIGSGSSLMIIFSGMIWGITSTTLYLAPYIRGEEPLTPTKNIADNIFNVLRYVPISKEQYIKVRMSYLNKFYVKQMIIGILVQCVMAVCEYKLEIWNILYPVVMLYILPVGWEYMWSKYRG